MAVGGHSCNGLVNAFNRLMVSAAKYWFGKAASQQHLWAASTQND